MESDSLIAERDLLVQRAESERIISDSIELVLWGEVKTLRKENTK